MNILDPIKPILKNTYFFSLYMALIGAKAYGNTFISEYVRLKPGVRILDIGCGNGMLVPHFKDTKYTGIDNSTSYIKYAKKAYPWAHFIFGDFCTQELPAASADIAVICGVLHHLDDAQCAMLFKNLSHALSPGGVLATIDPVFSDDQSAGARWIVKNDRGQFVRWQNQYRDMIAVDFNIEESVVRHDMLRIPYSAAIFRATSKR